jgi:CheY-like chemotaxis protein
MDGQGSQTVRIFVVDDDPAMRQMVANYLADHDVHAIPIARRATSPGSAGVISEMRRIS